MAVRTGYQLGTRVITARCPDVASPAAREGAPRWHNAAAAPAASLVWRAGLDVPRAARLAVAPAPMPPTGLRGIASPAACASETPLAARLQTNGDRARRCRQGHSRAATTAGPVAPDARAPATRPPLRSECESGAPRSTPVGSGSGRAAGPPPP